MLYRQMGKGLPLRRERPFGYFSNVLEGCLDVGNG